MQTAQKLTIIEKEMVVTIESSSTSRLETLGRAIALLITAYEQEKKGRRAQEG